MEVIYNIPGQSSSLMTILAPGSFLSLPYDTPNNK